MVSLDEAAAMAQALPEVAVGERYGRRSWSVRGKTFLWERPFSKADVKRFGAAPPPIPPILAVRVDDLDDKESVLAAGTAGVFTIPHFDGYPAVLVELGAAGIPALRELIVDGWLAVAPPALAAAFLAEDR